MSPSLGPSQMSELFCGSVDMTSETSVFTGVARARNEYVRGKRGPQMSFGARQARAVQISGELSANRKLSCFRAGISPVKSASSQEINY